MTGFQKESVGQGKDLDSTYSPGMQDVLSHNDVEEEIQVGTTIQCQWTQHLRTHMIGRLVDKIQYILEVMDSLGINLIIFLDAVSWNPSRTLTLTCAINTYMYQPPNTTLNTNPNL